MMTIVDDERGQANGRRDKVVVRKLQTKEGQWSWSEEVVEVLPRWCSLLSWSNHHFENDMRWRRQEWCRNAHRVSSKIHM